MLPILYRSLYCRSVIRWKYRKSIFWKSFFIFLFWSQIPDKSCGKPIYRRSPSYVNYSYYYFDVLNLAGFSFVLCKYKLKYCTAKDKNTGCPSVIIHYIMAIQVFKFGCFTVNLYMWKNLSNNKIYAICSSTAVLVYVI